MDAEDRTSVPVRTALTMEELTADQDVELWLFRMPLDFNADTLTKNKLKIDEGVGTGAVLQVIDAQTARKGNAEEDGLPSRETNGDSYEVLLGETSESNAYQILVQAAGDAAGVLRVAPSITKHFVVAQRPPNTPSTAAAAAAAAATESGDDDEEQPAIVSPKRPSRMVVPYTHVPQIQGLEVRFKMPGTGSAPPPPQWWKEGVEVEVEKEEEDEDEDEEEEELRATIAKEKEKKKKRRASDGGALKMKKGGEEGGEGGREEEDPSSPEKKKAKNSHKEKKGSKRQSV